MSMPRTIQAVDRAVAVLDLLSNQCDGMRLSDIAERLGLKAQTVQSLLRTLQHHGLIAQAGRGARYTLGPRVHQWSRQWMAESDWTELARPVVARLGEELGEYVLLAEFRGDSLIPLLERSPNRSLVVTGRAENPAHLHTMATAKVLLAWADEHDARRIVAGLPMVKRGPRSVTSHDAFLASLQDVRRTGFAECIDETGEGIVAIAVPVDTPQREGALALGVAMPKVRYTDRDKTLKALLRAAGEISSACGAGA